MLDVQRVLSDLRQVAALTSDDQGAQRVAFTPLWGQARQWLLEQVGHLSLSSRQDQAGNLWIHLPGASPEAVVLGSHLDSVPNGGWLDGVLGVLAGLEVLRHYRQEGLVPASSLYLVDWADEEGARFGRSLFGSSAAAGTLDLDEVRGLVDRQGLTLAEALAPWGLDLEQVPQAHLHFRQIPARAYLELHIEQGPVLEALGHCTGVVQGTFGVERHRFTFVGQAAHSGATPIPLRQDAFLAAAEAALEFRRLALAHSTPEANVVCTVGSVQVEPGIVTAVPGRCQISLDQRALDPRVLAQMWSQAQAAALRIAADHRVEVSWETLWSIEPRPFDSELLDLCEAAVREVTGQAHRLPSGPLHDAAEMAPWMATVMMFASSSRGLSHCRQEDTPVPHLEKTLSAFFQLVDQVVLKVGG